MSGGQGSPKVCRVCGSSELIAGRAGRRFCDPCWKKNCNDKYAANPEKFKRQTRKSQLARYGLTLDDYDAMFREQRGVCAICRGTQQPLSNGQARQLCVDHDHLTGRVRSLLCTQCNSGLGFFRESPWLLNAAARYIEDYHDNCSRS